jgi:hypothetical protein
VALVLDCRHARPALRIRDFERDGPRTPLAEMVDGGVAGDPEKPGRELELRVVAVESLEDLQEDFLRQIERIVPAADHTGDVRNDAGLISPDENLEERLLSREDPGNEVEVVGV